jgi:hypothetical protein
VERSSWEPGSIASGPSRRQPCRCEFVRQRAVEPGAAAGRDLFLVLNLRGISCTTSGNKQYCLSTLDKSDGLPRVPAGKMSGNEQDRLTDELTLSASWVSAAHARFELAASMPDEALAQAGGLRVSAPGRASDRDTGIHCAALG